MPKVVPSKENVTFSAVLHAVMFFLDCYDHFLSGKARDGIYKIKPVGTSNTYLVNCELVKQKGWTIIQRRQDGLTDFFQDWNTYKKGFGGTCTVKPVLSGHPNRTPKIDLHYQLEHIRWRAIANPHALEEI